MRGAILLLTMWSGCEPPQQAPAPPAPVALTQGEDPTELVTDVQHLLGESAALHAAGRYVVAEATWRRAYNIFGRSLLPTIRREDPTEALAMEYRFGQLRNEVTHRRGRPKPLARQLEKSLEQRRETLVLALTPPPVEPITP